MFAAVCNIAVGGKEAQNWLRNLYAPLPIVGNAYGAPHPLSFVETLLATEPQDYPQFVEMVPLPPTSSSPLLPPLPSSLATIRVRTICTASKFQTGCSQLQFLGCPSSILKCAAWRLAQRGLMAAAWMRFLFMLRCVATLTLSISVQYLCAPFFVGFASLHCRSAAH